MDYRRETDANPEANCEYYNKCQLRAHAREHDTPVLRFPALHEGISQEEGLQLPDSHFNDLPAYMEIAKEARVLLTSNLNVEQGLLNGSQGTVKGWIFKPTHEPNHQNPACRSPAYVIVDVPKYTGPSFWNTETFPERKTWIPLEPKRICDSSSSHIYRLQFPLVLAWALTPWKAQGMTLEKAVVQLGSAAAKPGVAFVALSRVKHPDDLMLEDDFPSMSVMMRQKDNKGFQARQRWEREARVKFSKTLRTHMNDITIYSPEKCWQPLDNEIANAILQEMKIERYTDINDFTAINTKYGTETSANVWKKLHMFPHMFEIAAARGELDDYNLNGTKKEKTSNATDIRVMELFGWRVNTDDVRDFITSNQMSTSLMELLAKVARRKLMHQCTLHNVYKTKRLRSLQIHQRTSSKHVFLLESMSQHWAMAVLDFTDTYQTPPTLRVWIPETIPVEAFKSAVTHITEKFRVENVTMEDYDEKAYTPVALLDILFHEVCPTEYNRKPRLHIEMAETLDTVLKACHRYHQSDLQIIFNEETVLGESFWNMLGPPPLVIEFGPGVLSTPRKKTKSHKKDSTADMTPPNPTLLKRRRIQLPADFDITTPPDLDTSKSTTHTTTPPDLETPKTTNRTTNLLLNVDITIPPGPATNDERTLACQDIPLSQTNKRQLQLTAIVERMREESQRGIGDMDRAKAMKRRSEARAQQTNLAKRVLPSCSLQNFPIESSSKQRRLEKQRSCDSPTRPATDAKVFQDFFEKQTPGKALCGLHALNNAIGAGFFNESDMSNACTDFLREATREGLHEKRKDHEIPRTGWYSEALMAYVINWKIAQNAWGNMIGGQMLLDLNNPILPHVDASLQNVYDPNVYGIIVNKNNTHWITIRHVDNEIWLLDSLQEPKKLSWPEYTNYITCYPHAYPLLDNV